MSHNVTELRHHVLPTTIGAVDDEMENIQQWISPTAERDFVPKGCRVDPKIYNKPLSYLKTSRENNNSVLAGV